MRRRRRGRVIELSIGGGGYLRVELNKNGKGRKFMVHRLVAQAFVPNPRNYPWINHRDGLKTNARPANLQWCTPSQNSYHAVKTGLWKVTKKHRNSAAEMCRRKKGHPVRCVETNIVYPSAGSASVWNGMCSTSIGQVCKGRRKTAGGYCWEWFNKDVFYREATI